MNKKQLVIMWAGIAAILLVSAFPYYYLSSFKTGPLSSGSFIEPLGRHFVFTPPVTTHQRGSIWIDLAPLHIEWTVISAITIGLVVAFRDKKK